MTMQATTTVGHTSIARDRAMVYEVLASCFLQEPDAELLKLAGEVLGCLLNDMPLPSQGIEDLRQEYYDRFFVPMSGRYVPPYESAVRGRTDTGRRMRYGSLMGPNSHSVMAAYDAVRFDPWQLSMYEPLKGIRIPDHMGLELAFMALMAKSEARARAEETPAEAERAERWLRLQRQFLEEHLNCWSGDFAALVAGAGPGFYPDVCRAVAAWVQADLSGIRSGDWAGEELM